MFKHEVKVSINKTNIGKKCKLILIYTYIDLYDLWKQKYVFYLIVII